LEPSWFWIQFAADLDHDVSEGSYLISVTTNYVTWGANGAGWAEYTGVLRHGEGTQWLQPAQPWTSFAAADANYFNQGPRMFSLGLTTSPTGQVLYTGVWKSQ
jgi:hypothetical protein